MAFDPNIIGTVALASLASASTIGIWALRQEGRLNAHDQRFELTEKLADERHEDLKEDLKVIKQALGVNRNV